MSIPQPDLFTNPNIFTEKYISIAHSSAPNCMDLLLENMKSRQFANPIKISAQIQLKMSALSELTN